MEDAEKLAFWGIVLKPGEPALLELEDGETLHVSMVSLGVELSDKHGRSVITAAIRNSEDEGEPEKKFALSTLTAGKTETVCMDVSFIGEENITFEVTGKNIVHLVGNFSFENDIDSDSDSDEENGTNLIGVYDDDNNMSDDDDDDDNEEEMPRLIMDKDPPVITELSDDDEQPTKDNKTIIVKKRTDSSSKIANGKYAEPNSKKGVKGGAVNVTKALAKKAHKNVKVDEPLVEDEEEGEVDSEDESDIDSSSEDVDVVKTPAKVVKEAISDDDDDKSNDEEDESESEDEEEGIKKRQIALKEHIKKKSKTGKPGVVFKEVPTRSGRDEDAITPNNAKTKQQRKRGVSIGAPDGITPPQTKKSKISERPGTPAVSKSKGKSSGSAAPPRSGGNERTPNAAGPSGKKATSAANGVPGATSTPPRSNVSTPAGGVTSGKKKRRRTRKSRDSS